MMNISRHTIQGKHFTLLLMCLFACFVSSCKTKPIISPVVSHRDVTFEVNWKNISTHTTAPANAKLWLYPEDGTPAIIIDLPTDKRVTQSLPLGNFRVIIRNDDLATLKTRGQDKFDSHEAYLEVIPASQYSNFSTKNDFQPTQETIEQADMLHMLMGSSAKLVSVTEQGNIDVAFYPQTLTTVYKVNLEVTGTEPIASGIVRINNIATSVNFATGKVSAPSDVAIQFPLNKINETQFQSVALALGGNPEMSGVPNATKMHVTLQYADPNIEPLVQTVDMTEEFEDPTTNLDIEIKIDPSTSSPSINVTVTPWKNIVEEDIVVSPNKK